MMKRTYIPGDEWLYYKIYCGVKTADEVITQIVLPVSISLQEQNIINKWFFIRYSDPDLHLRVRFHFNDAKDIGVIICEMNSKLNSFVETNKIWKVMFDTYHREIERYHPKLMTSAEELFWIDSETTSLFLDTIEGDEGERIRWMFALKNIDTLLADFGFSALHKLSFIEKNRAAFSLEFGMDKNLKHQLDQKYRGVRSDIQMIMSVDKNNAGDYLPFLNILEQRTNRIIKIVGVIKELERIDERVDVSALTSSYVHMAINRIFRSKQRLHELVVYDFLHRHYKSIVARKEQHEKPYEECIIDQ